MTTNAMRRALAGALTLAVAATLTACAMPSDMDMGSGNSDPAASSAPDASVEPNNADVMFVGMMIPHHEEAVEMADMLLEKDGVDSEVVELAEAIKAAQVPEIELMQSWLDAWDSMPAEGMGGMDHGGDSGMGSMMGMSEEDMQALEEAPGPEAGDLFLELMIVHHEGAIVMAQDVLDDGRHPDVLDLATQIISDQAAEIELMRSMLDS